MDSSIVMLIINKKMMNKQMHQRVSCAISGWLQRCTYNFQLLIVFLMILQKQLYFCMSFCFEVIALKFEIAKMQIASLKQRFRKEIRAKQLGQIKDKKRSQLLANSLSADSIQEESSCSTSRSSMSSQEQMSRAIGVFEEQAIRRIREGDDDWAGEYSLQDANRAAEKLTSMEDDGEILSVKYFLTLAGICLKREYFQLLNYKVQDYFSALSQRFYYFFEVTLLEAIKKQEEKQGIMRELEEVWIAVEKILSRELTKKAKQNKLYKYCQILLTRKINFMLDNELLNSESVLQQNMNRFIGILYMQSDTISISNEIMSAILLLVKEVEPIRIKIAEDLRTLESFLIWHLLLIKQAAQDDIEENGEITDSELKENFNFVLLLLNTVCSEGQELDLSALVYQTIIEIGILSISPPPNKEIIRDLFIFIESYRVYSIPQFSKAISMICYESIILEVGHELELVAIELLGLMQERGRIALQKLQIHYAYCMKQKKECFELLRDCLSSIRNMLGQDEEPNLQDEMVKSL